MEVDPNPYLATVAQVSGALVAILGGLLAARLVSLRAELGIAAQAAADREARANTLRSALSEATHTRVGHAYQRLVRSTARRIARDEMTTEYLARVAILGTSDAEIQKMAADAMATREDLRALGFDALEARLRSNDGDYVETLVGRALMAQERGSEMWPEVELDTEQVIAEVTRLEADVRREQDAALALGETEDVLRRTRSQVRALRSALKSEWWTFAALAYMTLVSVVLPVALLASRPVHASRSVRQLVFWLFASAVVVVGMRFVASLRSLGRFEIEGGQASDG